jgi:(p)ppGpp synthase/HD superfamily hydrolase
MSTLEKAIVIAAEAHRGQTDKAREPYILHPLRVMLRVSSPVERMAAVLHDVLEDSDWTLADLEREGFCREVLEAVDALTRCAGESYEDFLHRAAGHPVALRVKLADLEDNLDLSRIGAPTEADWRRMVRYRWARSLLQTIQEKVHSVEAS